MSAHEFDAVIEEGRGGGAWIEIPFSVPQVVGVKGRVKVKVTFDGHPYRGSIAPMGGAHILGVPKAIRVAVGKSIGDPIHVTLEEDVEPRVVDVPEELTAALRANPQAKTAFEKLAYTHQREYARWIAEAKRPETRERRVQSTIERLTGGEKP